MGLPRRIWFNTRVGENGALLQGQAFYRLETGDESSPSGAGGMTADTEGFLYAATRAGAQVCDQPGRVNAILEALARGRFRACSSAGRAWILSTRPPERRSTAAGFGEPASGLPRS